MCPKCAKSHELNDTDCNDPPSCVNCKGAHPAFDRRCPKWIFEKEVVAVKTRNKLSFGEARKVVEARCPAGASGNTYANATIAIVSAKPPTKTASTQWSLEDIKLVQKAIVLKSQPEKNEQNKWRKGVISPTKSTYSQTNYENTKPKVAPKPSLSSLQKKLTKSPP